MNTNERYANYMHGFMAGLGHDATDRDAAIWTATWAAGFRAGRTARRDMERDKRRNDLPTLLVDRPDLPA